MHGQSPTSTRLADQGHYAGKPLVSRQKAAPIAPTGMPRFEQGSEVGGRYFGSPVGGKDHGSDPAVVLPDVWRGVEEPSRHSRGAGTNPAEVYLLPRVEGAGATGNRGYRPRVGNSRRAVGVSPQTHRVDGEND